MRTRSVANQADKAKGRSQLFGIFKLGGRAKIHRQTRSDQGVEVQVFFFEKQLDNQFVEPRVKVPVEQSQIVTGDVIAKISELDALSFTLAAALAPSSAHERLCA